MAKRSKSELLRLALLYAAQDREGYAESDSGPEGREAADLAREFRALMSPAGVRSLGDELRRMVDAGKLVPRRIQDVDMTSAKRRE